MKKYVRICLIYGFLFVFIWRVGAQDTLDLPEVIVADNRMELPFSAQSRSLQVIRKAEIAAAPVNSVAELLQYVAGIDVRQRGANGVQVDIGIRGGSFDQTLVLVNGIKISDLQTGHHSMNLPVDLEAIDRIEVLKGPAARIYGQNAFAGAINIVTNAPDETFARISSVAGAYGLGRVSAGVSLPKGKWRQYASYAHDWADGYRYNTDYRLHTASYQAAVKGEQGETRLFAGWSGRDFGANGFYGSPSFTEQYEAIQTTLLSVDSRLQRGNWLWKPRAFWRFNEDEYLFTRSNPKAYRNFHKSHIVGAELHGQYQSNLGITGIGVEAGRQLLMSNRLGARDRNTISVFAEQRLALADGRIDVTPGILWNYYSDFGAQLLPGIEAGWQINAALRMYGNAGYTYRVPTFTDLYYLDPGSQGNPDLKPESALAWEGGVKWSQKAVTASVAVFNRSSENLIDWTKASDKDPWKTRNLGQVIFQGWEAQLETRLSKWMPRGGISYTYINAQQVADVAFRSRYALDQLKHQLHVFADMQVGKRIFPSIHLRYLDRVNLEDYTVLDAKIRYQAKHGSVFVEATNLTNTAYTETNLVPMPGRWVSAGLNLRLVQKKK